MPYIKKEDKLELMRDVRSWPPLFSGAGKLNWLITVLVLSYYRRNGGGYQQINDVVGALEGAKLEFYRRVAAPYEDKKIEENGDVYV